MHIWNPIFIINCLTGQITLNTWVVMIFCKNLLSLIIQASSLVSFFWPSFYRCFGFRLIEMEKGNGCCFSAMTSNPTILVLVTIITVILTRVLYIMYQSGKPLHNTAPQSVSTLIVLGSGGSWVCYQYNNDNRYYLHPHNCLCCWCRGSHSWDAKSLIHAAERQIYT